MGAHPSEGGAMPSRDRRRNGADPAPQGRRPHHPTQRVQGFHDRKERRWGDEPSKKERLQGTVHEATPHAHSRQHGTPSRSLLAPLGPARPKPRGGAPRPPRPKGGLNPHRPPRLQTPRNRGETRRLWGGLLANPPEKSRVSPRFRGVFEGFQKPWGGDGKRVPLPRSPFGARRPAGPQGRRAARAQAQRPRLPGLGHRHGNHLHANMEALVWHSACSPATYQPCGRQGGMKSTESRGSRLVACSASP